MLATHGYNNILHAHGIYGITCTHKKAIKKRTTASAKCNRIMCIQYKEYNVINRVHNIQNTASSFNKMNF